MSKYFMSASWHSKNYPLLLAALLFYAALFNTQVFGKGLETLQFHGFASQGYILTSDNQFFGDSEEGSFDFTELGLNASIRPVTDLQFSAQLLSRRAGEADKGDIRLDYGLIDYRLLSSHNMLAGLRLGRIKNPMGFYNDTRDVAFTRSSIFLPQSIYFDRTRNLALSADGFHLYGEHRSEAGDLFFQFGSGYPDVENEESELTLLGRDWPGHLEDKISHIGRIIFEPSGGKIRLGLSGVVLNIKYKPGASDPIRAGTIRFRPLIFSAQYNAASWSLTSEYARRQIRMEGLASFLDRKQTGESFYFQGTLQIVNKVEGLVRYDVLYQNRQDRHGSQFAAASLTGAPDHSQFAKDWTLGLRWDMTKSLMSRIEYHYVNGTAWLPASDNLNAATKRYWDMFALLISYRF